ncbi:MAG TPA: alanine--tRNA ligase-related protein [Pyrinomonadaceae bacterium]|nr:alanine--tRNA ligase-related protein [Pyrinomonadaceae bacterium]
MISAANFPAAVVGPPPLELNEANWANAVVRALFAVMERYGSVFYDGGPLIPPGDTSTLFTTAGIQHWREWVLAASPESDPGRVGPQWCVRMNNLEKVGRSNFLTSFCMLSSLTRGPLEREQALSRMFEVFVTRWNLPFEALSFVVTGAHPLATEDTESIRALERLGVSTSNYAVRPRKWACPFKPYGPTGPELFVLLDKTRVPCQSNCGPMCNCGRYFHFWNLEFLENRRLPDGGVEKLTMPFLDSAGSIEWVVGAITRTFDLYDSLPFRGILESWQETAGGGSHLLSREQLRILTDHSRTIALLFSAGVKPDAKQHGHVLRRLIRRSFAIQTVAQLDLSLLSLVIEKVQESYRRHEGFPVQRLAVREMLDEEASRFEQQVRKSRKIYDRIGRDGKNIRAEEVYRLHAECGLPWETIEHWLKEDGVELDLDRLTELRSKDKETSRRH